MCCAACDRLRTLFSGFQGDALIVGIIRRGDPEAQDIGADCLITSSAESLVAERLRHLAAVFGHGESMCDDLVVRRPARVPQLSSSEEWNQPRCWSEPSR